MLDQSRYADEVVGFGSSAIQLVLEVTFLRELASTLQFRFNRHLTSLFAIEVEEAHAIEVAHDAIVADGKLQTDSARGEDKLVAEGQKTHRHVNHQRAFWREANDDARESATKGIAASNE